MKIKGNMKKATLFTPDLFPPPTPENLTKYLGSATGNSSSTPAKTQSSPTPTKSAGPELRTQKVFDMMRSFLDRGEGKALVT